jgi:hypothetical protein
VAKIKIPVPAGNRIPDVQPIPSAYIDCDEVNKAKHVELKTVENVKALWNTAINSPIWTKRMLKLRPREIIF